LRRNAEWIFCKHFGILLLGIGLGALLIWLQQTDARKQFRQELEIQIDQALFGELRRQRLLNICRESARQGETLASEPYQ
jgi:uncharacterized membrane-anchored protein YhcB (DUF1043 family)